MSFTGVCQVCESAEAEYSCDQCGAQVCDEHYDRGRGICAECAARLGEEKPDGDTPAGRDGPGSEDIGPDDEMSM